MMAVLLLRELYDFDDDYSSVIKNLLVDVLNDYELCSGTYTCVMMYSF